MNFADKSIHGRKFYDYITIIIYYIYIKEKDLERKREAVKFCRISFPCVLNLSFNYSRNWYKDTKMLMFSWKKLRPSISIS